MKILRLKNRSFWIIPIFMLGVIFRCMNYFPHSSMHFDELTSALNIRDRSFYQLATQSLDYNQVAPIGFLWLEKLATLWIGVNDVAYRFFPFLFSLLSMVLFYSISKQFLKGIHLLGALLLFMGSISAINQAGEAKQYSGEIAASLFLIWSALQLLKGPLKPTLVWLLACGGFLFILCALPSALMAPMVLSVVFLSVLNKKTALPISQLIKVAIPWGIACLLLTIHAKFIIAAEVQQAMSGYWSVGFAPQHSLSDFMLWLPVNMVMQFIFFLIGWMGDYLAALYFLPMALLALSLAALSFLIKRNGWAIFILFAPLLTALLLAIFKLLPFYGRVGIYATWPFLISGMAGVAVLKQGLPRLISPAIGTSMVMAICMPLIIVPIVHQEARPPYNSQSTQPVLRELKKQMQPGDRMYVYFKARHALRFYGPKEGISSYQIGGSYQTIEPFLREIDSLKGCNRVWFLFTQWTPEQSFPDSMKVYLGTVIGKEIGKIPDPDGRIGQEEAAAYLYDLSTTK